MYRLWVSQMVLAVKNPPANTGDMRDAGLISGWGRPLEEGMATHSSILAWKIPWTEEPGGLQTIGSQRVRHNSSDLAQTASVKKLSEIIFVSFLPNTICLSIPMWSGDLRWSYGILHRGLVRYGDGGEGAAGLPKHHLLGTEGALCFRGTYILRGGGGPGTMNSIPQHKPLLSQWYSTLSTLCLSGCVLAAPLNWCLSPEEVREDERAFCLHLQNTELKKAA